jgi:hypothetical protein
MMTKCPPFSMISQSVIAGITGLPDYRSHSRMVPCPDIGDIVLYRQDALR